MSVDEWAFTRYCTLQAQWREATTAISAEGAVLEGRTSPLVKIVRDLGTQLGKLEACFGLTPAARCSIHVAPKADTPEESIEAFAARKPRMQVSERV